MTASKYIHPRISFKFLWSLNQYGRALNRNRKTASPKSSNALMTLVAYQISPAAGETRLCAGRLHKKHVKMR